MGGPLQIRNTIRIVLGFVFSHPKSWAPKLAEPHPRKLGCPFSPAQAPGINTSFLPISLGLRLGQQLAEGDRLWVAAWKRKLVLSLHS